MPRAASLKPLILMKSLALSLALLLLAVPPLARAEPGILLFSAVGRPGALTLSGRVLKELPHGSTALSRNVRRLAASPWPDADLEVSFLGLKAKARSDAGGAFDVTFLAPKEAPFVPGQYPVEVRGAGLVGHGAAEIVSDTAPFVIISDFDDTIAVSNVTHKRGLFRSALLEDSDTQPEVPGMAAFYTCLREGKAEPPGLAVVSGTPWQYATRTALFLTRNKFPFAGLYMRDLGPSTLSNYKQPVIRTLMHRLTNQFILVGDSGEKDPEVYAQMRKEFPDRVAEIYIHQLRPNEPAARFAGMVPFTDVRQAAEHALGKGYLSRECLEARFGKGPAQAATPQRAPEQK